MKYTKTALLAAALLAITHQPLSAQGRGAAPETVQIQVAENHAPAPAVRNITASRASAAASAQSTGGAKPHPPGAQALMVLGLALIVTPAMFRGAFSN
jgi:hypothetical protein